MPNTISAKKRLRQNKVRRARNKSIKSSVKTQIKKVVSAVQNGDVESAEKEYLQAVRKLDMAGADKILHKNTAARYKSRLQKKIKALKTG